MKWPAVAAIAAAACGSGHGANLEITVPVDADEVDVFVAPDLCLDPDCDQEVGWDTSGGKKHGDAVFLLDVDAATHATAVGKGRYRVVLVGQDGTDQDVARVLVLAFQRGVAVAGWRLEDVTIPGTRAETWDIRLSPNVVDVPAGDPAPTSDGWRIHAWPPTEAMLNRCVVTEVGDATNLVRELYLRPGDTDCDGLPVDRECDPFYYLDPGSSTIDQVSCLALQTFATQSGHTCLLGGVGCSETTGTTNTCLPVAPEYCAPLHACDPACAGMLRACVAAGTVGKIHCNAVIVALDTPCSNPYAAPLSLAPLLAGSNTTCDNLGFASDVTMGVSFSSSWTTGAGGPKFTADGPGGTACDYLFRMQPAMPSLFVNDYFGVVDLPLSNGRHEVLPIQVTTQTIAVCPTAGEALFTCALENINASDSIVNCATAP